MTTTAGLTWTPLKEGFGAMVDIDLNHDLTDAALAEIARLYDERHMLLFRGQDFERATQRKVVSAVGRPFDNEVDYVSSVHDAKGNAVAAPTDPDPRTVQFHSDLVFDKRLPVEGISLYAEDVSGNTQPGFQGTSFVCTRDAYLNLPKSARTELEGRTLISLHSRLMSTEEQNSLRDHPFAEIEHRIDWWAEHPLFSPLPRTGELVLLYIPWFAHSISGMSPEESKGWFAEFEKLLYDDPDKTYTLRYEQGDLVLWNNLAMQHAKEQVEGASALPKRVLRRVAWGPEEWELYLSPHPKNPDL